jgi:RND family efflux transporter MFP subunit
MCYNRAMKKYISFSKRNLFIYGGIVVVLIIVGYFAFFRHTSNYQFVAVQNGSITESVSLTGNTISEQSVSLAFGSSGIISHTYSALGKEVRVGQVLAELDTNDLVAQLHSAEAGLTIAEQQAAASKNNVVNVTSGQDILVKTAYQNLLNSTLEAVPKDSTNDYTAPIISGNYILGKEGTIYLHYYASSGGTSFTVSGLTSGIGMNNTITSQPIGNSGLYIKFPADVILNDYDWVINIPNTKATNYLSNYNAYELALQTRDKAIADAEASVGTTDPSSVTNAKIAQAQASIDSINAKIKSAKIIAPIGGIVTQFDAKIGQLASPSSALISVISSNGYEVDAGVSETDIGKILVGDKVSMTLDAFPGEIFSGSVFYLAPADTNIGGVISYQVKISFDNLDSRLKSGLTANIDIQTKHKDGVLVLPQYAILQNDQGTFVETLENNKIKQNPVTLGITDQKGNVEVVSGVAEGEQVLNIGLKAQ